MWEGAGFCNKPGIMSFPFKVKKLGLRIYEARTALCSIPRSLTEALSTHFRISP